SGLNKIATEKHSVVKKLLKSLISPISIMFLTAAAFSYFGGKLFDFYFIIALMFLNFFISFWQENKADNAIEELNKLLKFSVKVLRDGKWNQIDSEMIVSGDIVEAYIGEVMAADLKIINSQNFSVNEAALTGESLPAEKKDGDIIYSGSFVVTGQALAQVIATGVNTYFGKIFSHLDKKPKRSLLEKDILTISKFLSLLSIGAVVILTAVFLLSKQPLLDVLTLDLSLLIAGIPIALPTVLTLIISLGVLKLSKENVVVRRLASLEDLANVDWLFTDKTGTLTKNEIVVNQIVPYKIKADEVLTYAFLASISNDHDLINKTIIKKARASGQAIGDYEIKNFIPADSRRKRSSVLVNYGGRDIYISVGAVQVISKLCHADKTALNKLQEDVDKAATAGYRVLAVAVNFTSPVESEMQLVGLLLLSDELRQSAKTTLKFLRENGVKVKMLTGDHRAIAYRVGADLGLDKADVYSEILPDDKYALVLAGKKDHVVAVTGDGVNDLPAVKAADVGFAVSNAVAALKGTADIVLLLPGILVVTTAIIEARKIFARIYSYSIYRISESLRLIITILILGLIYHAYPLTPIQLILLAILNDIPIVSLAFNRTKVVHKPSHLKVKERFIISGVYGMVGVVNSMLFLLILMKYFHFDWGIISTAFFLKLTIGGHLLIFVAHTKERWYKFLPSRQVILALVGTQILATSLTALGIFMNKIPAYLIIIVWIWTILWMQVTDYFKILLQSRK
ncbi:MAG TPA: HAD-IC family P-type ATPase, partial [Candidatus Saccharimonadales bacterium]|nr:HAD-IC family P-type ATPase [Candidatus Saccharimonadales bacterium]